jgi:hypothetical protein
VPLVGVVCMCPIGISHFCRRVLVALDPSQRLVCSVEDELRWVIAKEALAHVDDGLDRRGLRGFVDDGPDVFDQPNSQSTNMVHVSECDNPRYITHQTSCLRPATLAAGLKGSLTMLAAANPLSPMTLLFKSCPEIARGRRIVVVINSLFSIVELVVEYILGVSGGLLLRERDLCQSRHKPSMARSAYQLQINKCTYLMVVLYIKSADRTEMEPLIVKVI